MTNMTRKEFRRAVAFCTAAAEPGITRRAQTDGVTYKVAVVSASGGVIAQAWRFAGNCAGQPTWAKIGAPHRLSA